VLRVIGATATPAVRRLADGRIIVGAGSMCDIIIGEPTVSRQHAALTVVADGVEVEDLGSRNGTFYMGQRISKLTLTIGSKIRFGAVEVFLDADRKALEDAALYAGDEYRGIVGTTIAMRRLFSTLVRLEGSLVPVLVTGESGVGKELVARALHECSRVGNGPLVTLNCGALPRDLIGSELFGHRRGAFTGAHEARKGAFERANGGTLFLDELGELPIEVQPILLRTLETGEISVVGGDVQRVRVRVVAATNRNLAEEVAAGRFRQDLYFRLAVVTLEVPPLRERAEDIEPLALRLAEALGLFPLAADVLDELKSRAFPGNVRELRNALQAYGAIGVLPPVQPPRAGAFEASLADVVDVGRDYASQKDALVDRFTRVYLQSLLAHTEGNQTRAAQLAGLDRGYLGRLLFKHGLAKK